MLDFKERLTAGKVDSLMVLLHGYGSNADDLISLVPEFADVLPRCNFISPNAPFPFELEPNMYAHQWYSLLDRSDDACLQGALKASKILIQFLDAQLLRFGLGYQDLILVGFSQGGMMALHNAIRFERKIKCAISLSGYLVNLDDIASIIKSKPPILITHGLEDNVVPIDKGRAAYSALKLNGLDVKMHESAKLSHGIDYECIDAVQQFLKRLDNKKSIK